MLVHWVWLSTRPGMNEREQLAVLTHFRDPEDIYYSTEVPHEALADKDLKEAEAILDACDKKNIQILTYGDTKYPSRLKNIPDPPLVLYYKGKLPDFEENLFIGSVGTRKASAYGMTTAKRMGYQLGRCGAIVVSGMAEGVDAEAVWGALLSGGTTVGVLGSGADVVYPSKNRALFREMEQSGCLLSEFPPETPAYAWNFPKRNRLISGLSSGVLVVEAPERSGALITARQAADQGRDLFVVPGNIDVASCVGSNALLREGAIAVSSGWDIVSEYEDLYPGKLHKDMTAPAFFGDRRPAKVAQQPQMPKNRTGISPGFDKKDVDKAPSPPYSDGGKEYGPLTQIQQRIIKALEEGHSLADDIIAVAALPAGEVLAALTMLQVKGIVTALPGRRFMLKK